ncbi:MAG TPA: tetratricopeptide repeat protein, partial [Chitinophagaceae bacterium]|nr:tetratricopeptide repeat protein [Chitinophagaceae bacterium]
MKRFAILLVLLMPFSFHGQEEPPYLKLYRHAESLYNAEAPTDQSDSIAFQTYMQAARLLEKEHLHDSILADSYTKAAILKQMKGEDSLALRLFAKALQVVDNNKALSDSLRYQPLLYAGSSHYTLNQFDSANYYYQLAEAIINKYPRLPERGRLYNKMGALYYEEGNFHQSLNYFSKALSLLDTTNRGNDYLLVNYYNNIAVAYKKLGQYEEALNTYKLILPYNISRDGLMHNIGTVYLELHQPQEALKYLHAVKVRGQQQYNNMAVAHLQLRNYDSAQHYLGLAMKQKKGQFKSTVNGLSWYHLGQLKEAGREYEQALETYHRAVIELDPDFNDTVVHHNPKQFEGLHSFSDLFNALAAKARIQRLLYDKTKQQSFLEHSLQTWETALLLAKTVQQGYDTDASRLFLNNNLQPASEEAAGTAYLLYQLDPAQQRLEKIFTLAETSKAAVLQIGIRQASLASLPDMPVNLLQRQKTEQILLARLQVQYETTTDTALLGALRQHIRDQEIKLSAVTRQLNENPNYAAAHNTQGELKVPELQTLLPAQAAMISYYLIGQEWLAFVLRKDSLFIETIPNNNDIRRLPQILRDQLPSHAISANQLARPVDSAHQVLIRPLQKYLQNITRLVIIPDHELQYIPFEVLRNAEGKMLLEDYAISY